MQTTPPATRWCHLTWSTAKHCKVFNIAALARFCERTLTEECRQRGWTVEVAILPERIHVLASVPPAMTRRELIHTIRLMAMDAVQVVGGQLTPRQVWEEKCWYSVVHNGPAVEAIRRRIRSINTPATTAPP